MEKLRMSVPKQMNCICDRGSGCVGSNGRYWAVDAGDCSITVDSAEPQPFIVELHRRSRLAIRSTTTNSNYVSGEQNGSISAKYPDLERATLWEY